MGKHINQQRSYVHSFGLLFFCVNCLTGVYPLLSFKATKYIAVCPFGFLKNTSLTNKNTSLTNENCVFRLIASCDIVCCLASGSVQWLVLCRNLVGTSPVLSTGKICPPFLPWCFSKANEWIWRQKPPTVPNFYATLFRRDIVRWFLVAEILRDFWLAPPTGRSWQFLWSNPEVPEWAVAILIVVFFIGVSFLLRLSLFALVWSFVWTTIDLVALALHFDSSVHWQKLSIVFVNWQAEFLFYRLCQGTLLALASVRDRSWCSSMVSNVLGYFWYWGQRPVGWKYRTIHLGGHLALAWCLRRYPGCWSGNGSTPDAESISW